MWRGVLQASPLRLIKIFLLFGALRAEAGFVLKAGAKKPPPKLTDYSASKILASPAKPYEANLFYNLVNICIDKIRYILFAITHKATCLHVWKRIAVSGSPCV
jgi:hypothetical protein